MPTVKVTFAGNNRRYAYSAPEGDWVKGDLAVVDSPTSGFVIVTVEEVDPADYDGNKPVVGMVSLAAYRARQAQLARKAEIIAQLERAAKARSEVDKFAHLRGDASLAALLEELESIK
jgi:hypothetical protein